jgi:glycine/D-amino acid oxidase-like deaminating enzyme
VIAAVNAFTSQLFPKEQVLPGRGTVLLTKPLAQLSFKGIFHFNEGYYYFREIDGRVLFGGGRNVDFEAETTTSFDVNGKIYESLIEKLRNDILTKQVFEIDMAWSGIMAFGKNKKPELKWLSEKVFGAYKMGGMGVAISSLAGEIAAENIVQSL